MRYFVTVSENNLYVEKYAVVTLTQQLLDVVIRLRDIVVSNELSEVAVETDAVNFVSDTATLMRVFANSVVFETYSNELRTLIVTDNIPIRDFEAALALPADVEDETYINDDVFVFGGDVYNGVNPEDVE